MAGASFEGMKVCGANTSVIDLYSFVNPYNKEVVATCINDQFGKNACSELLGQYSDLKVNFVDHFDY